MCFSSVLAKVITGYRIRNGVWTLLGKGNPQAPQVNNVVCLFVGYILSYFFW